MSAVVPTVVAGSGEFTAQIFATIPPELDVDFRFGDLSTPASVKSETAGVDAVVVDDEALTAEHISAMAPTVKIIGRSGTGLDAIDVAAAHRRGIPVLFLPDFATNEVADHTVALALASLRNIKRGDEVARSCRADWRRVGSLRSLSDSTVGLVGLGRIGRAVLARLQAFGPRLLVLDPTLSSAPPGTRLAESLDEVLRQSDLISLQLPLTSQTRKLLGAREFATMKSDAVLVNTSRGGVVDEEALVEALRLGIIGGAALDVVAREPLTSGSPILSAPNTLLTPHVAWYSAAAEGRSRDHTLQSIASFLRGDELPFGSFA